MKIKGQEISTDDLCEMLKTLYNGSDHYFNRKDLENLLVEYGMEEWKLASHRILDRLRLGGVVDSNEVTGWEFTATTFDAIADVLVTPMTKLVNYKPPKKVPMKLKPVTIKNGKLQLKPRKNAHGRLNK